MKSYLIDANQKPISAIKFFGLDDAKNIGFNSVDSD